MHNVIIMGSGRSGTSMVTGTLAKAGYFMGENLWNAREANPKGFFEDIEINSLNEDILEPIIPKRIYIRGSKRLGIKPRQLFRHRPIKSQMWLARIPVSEQISSTPAIEMRIQKLVSHSPYCFKDPRFSYTLPVWRPFLQDTVFVCVFRDPASTTSSVLKECDSVKHLSHEIKGIKMNWQRAIQMWILMYQHILEKHHKSGKWLFVHYNQALKKEGLEKISNFVQAPIDYNFPEARIRRSFSIVEVPKKAQEIYAELCKLADYQEDDYFMANALKVRQS